MNFMSPWDFNPDYFAEKESIEWPPSQTVPDDSLSLQEIIDYYTRGIDPNSPVYQSADDDLSDNVNDFGDDVQNAMIDYASLDLTEIDDIRRQLNYRANEIRKSMRSAENSVVTSDAPSLGQGGSESKTEEQAAQPKNTV